MEKITSLEKIKEIELNILKKVHEYCEENDIRYTLIYGTLIGAIRHNGFIPWDDDIDICMPRKDYERFEKNFPDWGKENHLYLAGPHSEEHYLPRHMLKVCDDRTILIENSYKEFDSMGLFIDIFPLDNTPNGSFFSKFWTRAIRTYKYRVLATNISLDSTAYKKFNVFKKAITCILRNGNTRQLTEIFERVSGRYKCKHTGKATIFYSFDPIVFNISDFFPAILHKFEDSLFYVPNGYDHLLRSIYGDYTKLPPEEKQIPAHTSEVFYK